MAILTLTALLLTLFPVLSEDAVTVTVDRHAQGGNFAFPKAGAPAKNDAAASAAFTLVDGERDRNGGDLAVLNDGRVPQDEDQPSANFFFRAGTDGGRIAVDLGRSISVKQVGTFSWHASTRGPQVYSLFAADSSSENFNPAPKRGTDPESCGWKRVASVDTRPTAGDGEDDRGTVGGQYGVKIAGSNGDSLGRFRHLLFDIEPTERRDAFGNTFFSEIDVVDADGPELVAAAGGSSEEPVLIPFATEDGRYHFTIDASDAPDLKEWSESKLIPVVLAWYPKIVAMLPSDGFEPATNVTLRFRSNMGGTPASAGGNRINMNSGWFRRELEREARGSVVHEMVHVVQNYGRARRNNPQATRTPGWIVEGLPDYIRWFLYEPETRGAEITERNLDRARHDASYRISGNFLNWVVETRDKELIRKLNAAAREGRYEESLWKEWTGSELSELADAWKKAMEQRIREAKREG